MTAEKQYQKNIENLEIELKGLKKKSNLWSYIRIIIVLGGFATITVLSDKMEASSLMLLTILFIVMLGVAVTQHLKVGNVIDGKKKLKRINGNEISVINQNDNFYNEGKRFASDYPEISNDLDLFGASSVFHFINRTSTFFGNEILKNYFINFTKSEEVIDRQKAVDELSGKLSWRQEFQKELVDINFENTYTKLVEFVNSKSFVEESKTKFNVFFYFNNILLAIFVASIIFFSKFSFSIFMVMFVVNSTINFFYYRDTNKVHQLVTNNAEDLNSFYKASELLETENWNSTLLKQLSSSNVDFSNRIIKLKQLLQFFDLRLNMVMGAVLNIFLLWDLRIIHRLDKWKSTNTQIKKHLEVIGEFEALNSFAILKFNNPNNCFPEISVKEFEIEAENLYHPLINRKEVVANSYSFEGKSRLDIITGPNMSGKSTFLRSVAINMILADTGSTVFADSFVFTPSKVLTYLHITDSVKDKISTFRAEIIKLKSILQEIETSEVPTFFILDEILRGTNSHSKFKGSVAIVKRLLELNSSGIIATHDVHLGEMENDFSKEIRNFSFDFIVDNKQELVYDYKLKDGINTKVNAEIVLKELGLVL